MRRPKRGRRFSMQSLQEGKDVVHIGLCVAIKKAPVGQERIVYRHRNGIPRPGTVPAFLVVDGDGKSVRVREDSLDPFARSELYLGCLLHVLRVEESSLQFNRWISGSDPAQVSRYRMTAGTLALAIEELP